MKEILIGLTMLGLFAFAFFIADRIGGFLEAVEAQNAEDAEETRGIRRKTGTKADRFLI